VNLPRYKRSQNGKITGIATGFGSHLHRRDDFGVIAQKRHRLADVPGSSAKRLPCVPFKLPQNVLRENQRAVLRRDTQNCQIDPAGKNTADLTGIFRTGTMTNCLL
jgi:hypothetical protein